MSLGKNKFAFHRRISRTLCPLLGKHLEQNGSNHRRSAILRSFGYGTISLVALLRNEHRPSRILTLLTVTSPRFGQDWEFGRQHRIRTGSHGL